MNGEISEIGLFKIELNSPLRSLAVKTSPAIHVFTLERAMARPRLHFVDEQFFDSIDSEAKAYWLGFLYADGHPAKRALVLGLAAIDGEHVVRFRTALRSEHAMRHTPQVSTVAISSSRLSARVRELRDGAVIPRRYTNHFVRGVFDGDGCIHVKPRGWPMLTIAGNRALLWKLRGLAIAQGIERSYLRKHSTGRTWVLHVSTLTGVCRFRDWMYRDATVYLARKKVLFDALSPLAERACVRCGTLFSPRYRDKGDYCSRKCYMQVYYSANRDTKWKENGAWKH